MNKTVLVCAVSALLLNACATGALRMAADAARVTNVSVENGYIIVDQEPIVVHARGAIRWNITTPGYSFPANGIEFKNPGGQYGNPATEFTGCGAQGAGFACNAAHSSPRTMYRYTIRVVPSAGGAAIEFDPTVMND